MDLPPLVRNVLIALLLLLMAVGTWYGISTAPAGYEACGPQPVTDPSDLEREAHGCKRQ